MTFFFFELNALFSVTSHLEPIEEEPHQCFETVLNPPLNPPDQAFHYQRLSISLTGMTLRETCQNLTCYVCTTLKPIKLIVHFPESCPGIPVK